MKPFIFSVMREILLEHMPANICEIGTHKGGTAIQLVQLLAPLHAQEGREMHYTGYDVFDFAVGNVEFNDKERNGKGGAAYNVAYSRIRSKTKKLGNFSFELHQGFTQDTLVEPRVFDFVYIDGGHSYDSVKHDYSMVKDSKLIIFDDYKIPGVRQLIDEIIESGVDVEIVDTPSKHVWAVIRNES